MNDFDLNNSETCLMDYNFGLLTGYPYDSEEEIFNQCTPTDEVRNKEITRALGEIESGAQFAFYNLDLSKQEQKILKDLKITDYNEISIISSVDKAGLLKQEINQAFEGMNGIITFSLEKLSDLVIRVVSIIVGELGVKDFELKIRIREDYKNEDDCLYWHLDKSENEILGQKEENKEKRFLITLKGDGTIYQKIDDVARASFMKEAEKALYYYGHGIEGCKSNDKINQLFKNGELIKTEEHYGSVHIAGSNGAMHAAPGESDSRLILLLTPKNNSTK